MRQRLLDMYAPLRIELNAGIKNLKAEILIYDKNFIETGPMVKGLKASEAADEYKNHKYLVRYKCLILFV